MNSKTHSQIRIITLAAALIGALVLFTLVRSLAALRASAQSYTGWQVAGGTHDDLHYSTLDQINRGNVRRLKVAWEYNTGDAYPRSDMECNPIIIGSVLFATTPKDNVIALGAATGKLLWKFNSAAGHIRHVDNHNRGVAYWASGNDQRIFVVAGHTLWALNARTGKPILTFGDSGKLDLRLGLGRDPRTVAITDTSPPVVYKNLVILGSTVPEKEPAAPGDVRAYDVRTGKMQWIFHTIPHPGEFGYNTWPKDDWKHVGGANDWGGMSLDENRGLLFCALCAASCDCWLYGADAPGNNVFSDSEVALDAATGKLVWYFQCLRHDVWDRDLPAAPVLVTFKRHGQRIDAVAQITKSGVVWVFNRTTGKPIFPVEYRKVPPSDVPGEKLSTEQPYPLLPPPFAPQEFTENMITGRTPLAHQAVLKEFREFRDGGQFTPPSLQGTILVPGFNGGGEWGGPAFDPSTGMLYVNSNYMVTIMKLVPHRKLEGRVNGRDLYLDECATCHGEDLRGAPGGIPPLVGIGKTMTDAKIAFIISHGGGMMPPFARLGKPTIRSIAAYLASGKEVAVQAPVTPPNAPWCRYLRGRPARFYDPDGYPPTKPPWGTLTAINLNAGKIAWQIPLGEYPSLVKEGIRNTGTANFGGPLVTKGGLVFIGATNHDRKFRAFDKGTGKLLWEATLPAAGNATPATYEINARQFVVIAAGGGKGLGRFTPSGGSYVAFALPSGEHSPSDARPATALRKVKHDGL
ncbi:MAG: pyrroloquinoline quinone-dependent dehydrogenase [Terriglobia bacterium]